MVPRTCLAAGAATWEGFVNGLAAADSNDFVPGPDRLKSLDAVTATDRIGLSQYPGGAKA